jgi:hypothetical protein
MTIPPENRIKNKIYTVLLVKLKNHGISKFLMEVPKYEVLNIGKVVNN